MFFKALINVNYLLMSGIDKKNWDKLTAIIKDSKSILLSTHINADGDGLGSEIAFYYYLKPQLVF